ncbi:hypothetical protein LSAT2_015536 [Lamellibrachia satsuma]|nr:hypothetical protein LSAT2_015536 [Lamellibrachia satsuma]
MAQRNQNNKPKREKATHYEIFNRDVPFEHFISKERFNEDWELRKDGIGYYNKTFFDKCRCRPSVYEMAVNVPGSGNVAVYVGRTKDICDRMDAYADTGSHKAEQINDVLNKGLFVMMRSVKRIHAMEVEDTLLETYDYAWNKQGQERTRHRELIVDGIKVSNDKY